VLGGVPVHLGQHAVLGSVSRMPVMGREIGGHLVGEVHVGEDAEHLVVEVHRAGQRVDLGPALQHQAADAALAEHDRGAGAGGAGADHDDRDVLWFM
jgi:hypothetical protein